MRFGPFPQRDIPKVEELLTKANLKYQVVLDETAYERVEEEVRSKGITGHPTSQLNPATIFVDVDDEDLEKMSPDLEKLGFSLGLPVPDFHNLDFVCPKCELSQETPGFCPKDGEKLLEFSDFAKHKNESSGPSSRFFYGMIAAVGLAILAYRLWG